MKKLLFIFAASLFFGVNAQTSISPLECISPFYHGVASGDPLHDRVILWTRITPIDFSSSPTVSFKVALDPTFTTLVAQGNYTTNANQDFTVKVDVVGLEPNTFYSMSLNSKEVLVQLAERKLCPWVMSTISGLLWCHVPIWRQDTSMFIKR